MMTSKVINTQTISTFSSIAVLSALTMGTLISAPVLKPSELIYNAPKYYSASDENSSSYDSQTDLLKSETFSDFNFEELLGELYNKVLVSQEELGKDFREVYFKNMWNLYDN